MCGQWRLDYILSLHELLDVFFKNAKKYCKMGIIHQVNFYDIKNSAISQILNYCGRHIAHLKNKMYQYSCM